MYLWSFLLRYILSERNTSERKANKAIIEQKKVDYKADRLKKVEGIRAENQSKKKVNQLSEKHAQKFAEYYLRLGLRVTDISLVILRVYSSISKPHVQ